MSSLPVPLSLSVTDRVTVKVPAPQNCRLAVMVPCVLVEPVVGEPTPHAMLQFHGESSTPGSEKLPDRSNDLPDSMTWSLPANTVGATFLTVTLAVFVVVASSSVIDTL